MRSITPADLERMKTLDCLEVVGLEVWAYHGVFDYERRDGQLFLIDVAWWQDLSVAAKTDSLVQTIDYGELSQFVLELVRSQPVALIETLVYRIQEQLLTHFSMDYIRVCVHKPDAPISVGFSDVAVTSSIMARSDLPSCIAAREVVISLGSNIEPRLDYLQFAVTALCTTPGINQLRVSPVYETLAQCEVIQADYLNAIVLASSVLPADQLLERTQYIESLAHRSREIYHGPRTLDIDLIRVGDEVWDTADLVLPHRLAAQRGFVLIPWLSLDPQASLSGKLVCEWASTVSEQPVRETSNVVFLP